MTTMAIIYRLRRSCLYCLVPAYGIVDGLSIAGDLKPMGVLESVRTRPRPINGSLLVPPTLQCILPRLSKKVVHEKSCARKNEEKIGKEKNLSGFARSFSSFFPSPHILVLIFVVVIMSLFTLV